MCMELMYVMHTYLSIFTMTRSEGDKREKSVRLRDEFSSWQQGSPITAYGLFPSFFLFP